MMPENELPGIPYPFTVTVDGRVWNLYSITYDTPDGKFETHIYALSFEHANMMLMELKENGRITGQALGAYEA